MKDMDCGRQMRARPSGTLTYTGKGAEKIVGHRPLPETGWHIAVSIATVELLAGARVVSPEQVIPLEEAEFKGF